MSTTYLRSISWRARVTLAGEFPVMRYVEGTEPVDHPVTERLAGARSPTGHGHGGRRAGAVGLAKRLLAPLARTRDRTLLTTLEVYLRKSGATPAICKELFIHRNTLTYRIKRIEELLNVDLHGGQVRATLLMALRLV